MVNKAIPTNIAKDNVDNDTVRIMPEIILANRKWQLEQMQIGLEQAEQGEVVSEHDMQELFNQYRIKSE
jgi:predicted transcriptional regulator